MIRAARRRNAPRNHSECADEYAPPAGKPFAANGFIIYEDNRNEQL